jgi:phosphonate transport system permease protein
MSIASISAVTEDEIAAVRARHAGAFSTPRHQLRRWTPWAVALAYLAWSLWFFEFGKLFESSDRVLLLLRNFVVWQDMDTWAYRQIYVGIAQTLAMAFLGTLLGTLGSLFVGFLAAKNVMPFAVVRQIVRRILDVLRGIDQLVWGLVFVRAVGLGPLAGVLAIFVSDLGTLSKLYSEAIENIDRKQVEGVRATGAGQLGIIRYGYLPQVLPVFISQSLYFLESNTRSATILGIVGAGGIGMIIIERFRASLYDQVAFVVLNVLVLIFAIDWLSKRVRLWLIGEKHDG